MKQKLLYILMIITALIGGNGEAWAQSEVPGYNGPFFDVSKTTVNMFYSDWTKANNNHFTYAKDYVTFDLTGKGLVRIDAPPGFYRAANPLNATLKWIVQDGYYIYVTQLTSEGFHTVIWNSPSHSINGTYISSGYTKNNATTAISNCQLSNSNDVEVTTGNGTNYIRSLSATYTISHYTLITTALDEATDYADSKSSSIDESIRDYLTTAISNATTFKEACAFPKSYWNGSPVGNTPADVTEEAAKLKAIADYLVVRTNASVYQKEDIPNEIYRQLHQYDGDDPNGFDSGTINTAKADIDNAITLAANTTETYKSVKFAIATAAARTDHNAAAALEADVTKATNELEAATTVDAINAALANIKKFDAFTFKPDVPSKIEEGNTLDNPASAQLDNVITYESSDNTIIEIDGTTLKALKPGTVTITAFTTTGDKYYGYKTTKEFTVTPKAVILYPNVECTIVPNIVYPEITLERSFSAKTHYTLTLPFDSNISDIDGDYAAQLALVTYNKADGYTLYFQKVADGYMRANQPYIVYAENGFNEPLKWTDITVAETIDAKGVSNDRTQGWTMQGNYTLGLSMEGKYGIVGGEFCLGVQGSTINAYTAYFTFLGTENVRTRVAVMDEGGNTTYIGELKDLDGNAAEEVFGIDGMRLPEMRKGIYIVRQKDGSVRKIVK